MNRLELLQVYNFSQKKRYGVNGDGLCIKPPVLQMDNNLN